MHNSNTFPEFSAIIFDMDGLVLDTEVTYISAWRSAGEEMGCEFSEEFCNSLSGLHYQDVEKKLLDYCGQKFDLKKFGKLSGQYWKQQVYQQGIEVKKGVVNLLKWINFNNKPYCLATNSASINALECLRLAKLEGVFPMIIARDHVKQGKPAPDLFLSAAESLKVEISKCLVLEDSKTGILAAEKAGAVSVFVPSVFPVDKNVVELANFYFDDLDQVLENIIVEPKHPV